MIFFLFQFGVYWSFGFAVCLRQCRQCCQHRHLFRSQSLSKMSGFGSQNARWFLQSYDLRSLWRWILLVVYERNLRFALLKPIRYNNKSFQLIYFFRTLLKSQFFPPWNYMAFLFNFRLYLLGQKTMVEKKEIIVATWNPCGCSGRNRVFGMYFGTSYAHRYSIMGWT